MADPITLLVSFIFLMAILKLFLMPGDTVDDFGSVMSVLVFVLAVAIYFFGIDPFPASLPSIPVTTLVLLAAFVAAVLLESVAAFAVVLVIGISVALYYQWAFSWIPLAPLHIIVVGMINAMAILDVFFTAVFGVPLSLDFFIFYLIPATFMYKFSNSLLNYVALFSERTVNFISAVMAFLMLESVITGAFNPVTMVLGIASWIGSFFGGDTLKVSVAVFFLALSITAVSVLMETVAVVVTSWAIGEVSAGTGGQEGSNPPV